MSGAENSHAVCTQWHIFFGPFFPEIVYMFTATFRYMCAVGVSVCVCVCGLNKKGQTWLDKTNSVKEGLFKESVSPVAAVFCLWFQQFQSHSCPFLSQGLGYCITVVNLSYLKSTKNQNQHPIYSLGPSFGLIAWFMIKSLNYSKEKK